MLFRPLSLFIRPRAPILGSTQLFDHSARTSQSPVFVVDFLLVLFFQDELCFFFGVGLLLVGWG